MLSQSIHSDIAYTLGDYLYRKFYPRAQRPDMDITNMAVTSALIAKKGSTSTPQLIQVTARTIDIHSGIVDLTWQNVNDDGSISEPFATTNLVFGNADQWLASWSPMAHLVQHRIEMLESLAATGQASRLSRNMAYTLFAKNLVDYADKYRGMQSVVMHQLEGFADVQLSAKEDSGKWTLPPYFIDSVAHLAGFIMNCSDTVDTDNNYCVTSGWSSMRFAEPNAMVAGARYRSYVKMIPTKDDPSVFLGDVYILRDNTIVGMVAGIHFRRFPRILLNRFFSAPEVAHTIARPAAPSSRLNKSGTVHAQPKYDTPARCSSSDSDSGFSEPRSSETARADKAAHKATAQLMPTTATIQPTSSQALSQAPTIIVGDIATPPSQGNSVADKALVLIARETALDLAELKDGAEFANLGVDSLMSLVLAEKFRVELDVKVNGSLFLDYPTIGDLRVWLDEYYC
jgi:monodictyphenone polyketide synthase